MTMTAMTSADESNNNNTHDNVDTTSTTTIKYYFEATGCVANSRLSPLLPSSWNDIEKMNTNNHNSNNNHDTHVTDNNDTPPTTTTATTRRIPNFLWENTPRKHTKTYRDDVDVYSHLPNGTCILDSKWVLGRLFSNNKDNHNNNHSHPLLATCETHCFVGTDGFHDFAKRMKLLGDLCSLCYSTCLYGVCAVYTSTPPPPLPPKRPSCEQKRNRRRREREQTMPSR